MLPACYHEEAKQSMEEAANVDGVVPKGSKRHFLAFSSFHWLWSCCSL